MADVESRAGGQTLSYEEVNIKSDSNPVYADGTCTTKQKSGGNFLAFAIFAACCCCAIVIIIPVATLWPYQPNVDYQVSPSLINSGSQCQSVTSY